MGARHAAKTLVGAAEAAAAPNPRGSAGSVPVSQARTGLTASAAGSGSVPPAAEPQVLRPAAGRPASGAPGAVLPAGGDRGSRAAGHRGTQTGGRRGLAEGGRRFGRAVWEPAARLSGVLWLEVTGLFFGIFVVVAAAAAWRLRGAIHLAPGAGNAQAHTELLMAVGMLVLFGYFAASSFLAASRRSRRR